MRTAPRAAIFFARAAAFLTLMTVGLGSVVCATKSGFDCHAWPGCYTDRFAPGAADITAVLTANPALEMVHRVTAMATGGVLVVTAIVVTIAPGMTRTQRLLPWIACVAAGGSALYGRASVLGLGVDAVGAAVDLLCALVAMTLSLATAVSLARGARFRLNAVSAPALLASALLIIMHVVGQLAAGNRSFTRCLSWPILWLASDDNVGVQVFRTALAIAALVALIVTIRSAVRSHVVPGAAIALALLLAAVIGLAVAYRASGVDGGVLGVMFALASVALLWTTEFIGARAAVREDVPAELAPQPVVPA